MATQAKPSAAPTSERTGMNGQGSLLTLTRAAVEDVIRLVQQEIRLARLEVKEMLVSNAWGGAMLMAAALCGLVCIVLALVTLALLLPFPAAAATGIEASVFLLGAIVLGLLGRSRLKLGPPKQTLTSLKEGAEWAKQLLKRNGK